MRPVNWCSDWGGGGSLHAPTQRTPTDAPRAFAVVPTQHNAPCAFLCPKREDGTQHFAGGGGGGGGGAL